MDIKYALYEAAVQDAEHDAGLYQGFYRQVRGRDARQLREDFCGTFALSCEWAKAHPKNFATALDLDPEPLSYGRRVHYAKLTKEQQSRVQPLRQDVVKARAPADLIVAGNFSFFIFQERKTLLAYFKSCRRALKPGVGALILDMAGGPSMIREGNETRRIHAPGGGRFTYIWDTQTFDPISSRARFAIHFKLPSGKNVKNAFTYDWRLWTIREVRELLIEAGFARTAVIWDVSKSEERENHKVVEKGSNEDSWIAYPVGLA